jgi:hypothetical protein
MQQVPRVYKVNGKDTEMYSIGELAQLLDRQSQTVRKWERYGVIPETKFRNQSGRRLYSKDQVEAVVKIAREEGICQGVNFSTTRFSERVHAAFKALEGSV